MRRATVVVVLFSTALLSLPNVGYGEPSSSCPQSSSCPYGNGRAPAAWYVEAGRIRPAANQEAPTKPEPTIAKVPATPVPSATVPAGSAATVTKVAMTVASDSRTDDCGSATGCAAQETLTAAQLEHLTKAAEHLAAGGFQAEAKELRDRVATLRQKQIEQTTAELARLQAKLASLQGSERTNKQVLLRVQVAEVSLTQLKKMGFDFRSFSSLGGELKSCVAALPLQPNGESVTLASTHADTTGALMTAMESEAVAKTLGRATLLLTEGRPASYLNGGNFPVPTVRPDKSVEIELKEFGTRIDAHLQHVEGNRYRLQFHPKVSQIDPSFGMKATGLQVPGILVHELDTEFEIELGQTSVLGSSVQQRVRAEKKGELGKTTLSRSEVQLVFLVTAEAIDSTVITANRREAAAEPQR